MSTIGIEIDDTNFAMVNPEADSFLIANPLFGRAVSVAFVDANSNLGSAYTNELVVVIPAGTSATVTLPSTASVLTGHTVLVKNNSEGKDVRLLRKGSTSDLIDGETFARVPGRACVVVTKVDNNTWVITHQSEPQVGTVRTRVGTDTFPGWYALGASPISRTTYSALFAIVGTEFGEGDGSTTFGVPVPAQSGSIIKT